MGAEPAADSVAQMLLATRGGRRDFVPLSRAFLLRRVWLLEESGSGEPYVHVSEDKSRKLDYFKLPHAFWFENWSERLDLPALSVLLIALSLPSTFKLPHERGGEWYGISRDTIGRGVATLRRHELLTMRATMRATPLSPTGATEERRYTLTGPFAVQKRRARRIPPTAGIT